MPIQVPRSVARTNLFRRAAWTLAWTTSLLKNERRMVGGEALDCGRHLKEARRAPVQVAEDPASSRAFAEEGRPNHHDRGRFTGTFHGDYMSAPERSRDAWTTILGALEVNIVAAACDGAAPTRTLSRLPLIACA